MICDHTVRRREMSDGARLYYSPPEYQILLNSSEAANVLRNTARS